MRTDGKVRPLGRCLRMHPIACAASPDGPMLQGTMAVDECYGNLVSCCVMRNKRRKTLYDFL